MRALGGLASDDAGDFITTPELMTSTDIPLAALRHQQSLIERRIAEAKEVSQQLPDTTLLLGSVAFDPTVDKPRNAVLFLREGEEVGRTYKRSPIVKAERDHLHEGTQPHEIGKPAPNILNIICSDLTRPPKIGHSVDTVLVSACWGVPSGYANVAPAPDSGRLQIIEYFTDELFTQHANLDTIIMTDRAPEPEAVDGLFNFVAQR